MNLKKIIWRSSHVEELIGVGWAVLAILTAILSYQENAPVHILKWLILVFVIMSLAAFYGAIRQSHEEMADENKPPKYMVIRKEEDRVVMRMVENEDDHPEIIEYNGYSYRLEFCNGKEAVFRKEKNGSTRKNDQGPSRPDA